MTVYRSPCPLGTVSARLVFDTLQHLALTPSRHMAEIQQLMAILPRLHENSKADLAATCLNHIKQIAASSSEPAAFFHLLLALVGCHGLDYKTCLFCLLKAAELVTEEPATAVQLLLGPAAKGSSPLLPSLVLQTLHSEGRIQKAAFGILRKVSDAAGEQLPASTLRPLLVTLGENRAELMSKAEENLTAVLEGSPPGEAALLQLLDQSLQQAEEENSCQLLEQLVLFFTPLKSCPVALEKLASFCLGQLDKAASVAAVGVGVAGCLCAVVDHFGPALPSQLKITSCYKFFLRCLVDSKSVVVSTAGLERRLSDYLVDRCSNRKLWKKAPADIVRRLLGDAVEHAENFPLAGRNMLCGMPLTASMFSECLTAVWPAGMFVSADRGKATVSQREKTDREDPSWTRSIFLLELLEMLLKLPTSPAAGGAKTDETPWAGLIAPLFVLLRKIPDSELEESSYKLNLLFTVLLQLFGKTSDVQLKALNSRDLDPELLTHCIRACPSPDTRQLALRVLAKCAVTSPDFVLHNSMTIFTFMGSHLLKVDSRHSYQVACQAIEVIVPAIKAASQVASEGSGTATTRQQAACQGILTTFMDAGLDVPEHRYTEFLDRLVRALDTDSYLWMALLLAIKTGLKPVKGRKGNSTINNKQSVAELMQRRMVELLCRFPAATGLGALLRVVVNTRGDQPQLRKMFGLKMDRREDGPDDWDLLRLR